MIILDFDVVIHHVYIVSDASQTTCTKLNNSIDAHNSIDNASK